MRLVLDASVAAKWYLDEDYSDAARVLLQRPPVFIVPDFFYAEVANVLWKRVQRRELTTGQAEHAYEILLKVPAQARETRLSVSWALREAAQTGTAVYDMAYVAIARQEKCPLITADRKLFTRTRRGLHAALVYWVEDAPAIMRGAMH